MFEPVAFARELIDIPSVSGEECGIGEFLERALSTLGFETRRLPVSENRFNLFARAGGRPRVVLSSHIDTVPPWFPAREDGEFLYGRGACDTKGVIAAMIAAGDRLRRDEVLDFALLFVVGEETDSLGAKRANLDLAGIGSEYIVVGEPTDSTFASASKGAFTCTAHFAGVAAHSAYPHLGDSAVHHMAAAIVEVGAAAWGSDPLLGDTTVNVGVVRGGEKPNIIAASAECEMIFRLVTTPDDVRKGLESILARHGGRIVKSHGNVPQQMVVPAGMPSAVVAFNTDVPHLSGLGRPLLFGPGSILDAHGESEKIRKSDLVAAAGTYYTTVVRLLEGGDKT